MRPPAPAPSHRLLNAVAAGSPCAVSPVRCAWGRILAAATLSALLVGCGLPRKIDSDVQSFVGALPAVTPATYRFERLPSQTDASNPSQVEALAASALSKVGLTQASVQPRYNVQVTVHTTQVRQTPYAVGLHGFWGMGTRWDGGAFGFMSEPPWYRHAVHLLLRDSTNFQPVFESSAQFEGPWSDTANLLPAILDAALQGYPNPPSGPRKVVIELPAAGQRP